MPKLQHDPEARRRFAGLDGAQWHALLWSVAVPAGATLASHALFAGAGPTNYLIVYLIGVLFVASRFGFWPSAVAALLSVLASDYLLIAPVYSLEVARPQDAVTLLVFLLAALVASRLTANLRRQGEDARERERRVRFLYELTRALAGARTEQEVADIAARQIARELPWAGRLLRIAPDGRLATAGDDDPARLLLAPEQRQLVQTVQGQVGQAIERIRLAREVQSATVLAQTEALRNSLLNAIAHDLRTPLASIVAAAGTLLENRERLSGAQVRELTESILEEGERMARLADTTLEMARLEAGNVPLERDWYPLEEIVGATLSRMEPRLRAHEVVTDLPRGAGAAGAPMAQVDLVMIVRVLENLIENAVKYTVPGTRIEIGALEEAGGARFRVADAGPGLAAGEERSVFEKFFRGSASRGQAGIGLGLTICRIIVQAHGGRIEARNRPAGGAEFVFEIPQAGPRPALAPEAAIAGDDS